MSAKYTTAVRRSTRRGTPSDASISYHGGSGAMASVPVVDRPREKLARVGAEALGDNELIALLLGSGTRSRGALLVAHDVIEAADGVQGLVRMGIDELCRIPGVGHSRAARLKAAVELGRRSLFGDRDERPQMLSTEDLVEYLAPRYAGFAVERFGVLLLDQKQRVIRSVILSTGTIDSSISHPRDMFRVAMLAHASHVVAFHNHPSGDPLPSVADRLITRRLQDAGEVIGITLLDHIILGEASHYSFRAEGLD
ncbi:MAG TPA: DNA repair protein RadC [Vicinamibacterales bacterium]|nr:DNA repair protein RadC [Vicinamibacterales bacterium]